MTYKISTNYLEHDGGTKFYETVLIKEVGGAPAMLFKRWGKLADKMGGGQVLVKRDSFQSCLDEEVKTLVDKRKLRSGKGRYQDVSRINFGMHQLHNASVPHGELVQEVARHFGKDHADAVANYFSAGSTPGEVVEEPQLVIEAKSSDDRWGSW